MYSFTNYLIMYDVADSARAAKVLGILRIYCYHVQHSVFEGKLRKSQIMELQERLKEVICESEDFVLIYPLSYLNIVNKISLGRKKFKNSCVF